MSTAHPEQREMDVMQMSSAGLHAFFKIGNAWKLTNDEQRVLLGEIPESTFYKWKSNPSSVVLQRDKLERISYILGIYKALQILFPNAEQADAWIKKPNNAPLFNSRSALDKMLSGNVVDLFKVRTYLDAQRGW